LQISRISLVILLSIFSLTIFANPAVIDDNVDYKSLTDEQRELYSNYISESKINKLSEKAGQLTYPLKKLSDGEIKAIKAELTKITPGLTLGHAKNIREKLNIGLKSTSLAVIPIKEHPYDFLYSICPQRIVEEHNKKIANLKQFVKKNHIEQLFENIYNFWWNQHSPLGPKMIKLEDNLGLKLKAIRSWNKHFSSLGSSELKRQQKLVDNVINQLKSIGSIEGTMEVVCPLIYTTNNSDDAIATSINSLEVTQTPERTLYLGYPQEETKSIPITSNKYTNVVDLTSCKDDYPKFCKDWPPSELQCLYKNRDFLNKECLQLIRQMYKFEMMVYKKEGIKLNYTIKIDEYETFNLSKDTSKHSGAQ
jgi:hypothetical protein